MGWGGLWRPLTRQKQSVWRWGQGQDRGGSASKKLAGARACSALGLIRALQVLVCAHAYKHMWHICIYMYTCAIYICGWMDLCICCIYVCLHMYSVCHFYVRIYMCSCSCIHGHVYMLCILYICYRQHFLWVWHCVVNLHSA